ncbi:MAG: DNA-3-methyladenine glycosylase I [Thermodesulfobacteriota bacterium]
MMNRCGWCITDPLMIEYHDNEWGVPVHDDRKHFEFIVLDGAQAGLSWQTVLRKREAYREAFDNFDFVKVARYKDKKIAELLQNPGIIRNKLKVNSAVQNARALLDVREEFGTFDEFIWQFVDGKTIHNTWKSLKEIPARTSESDAMSKDMKKRGFNFVGSTICYAYMQAAGLVNDHTTECFRHKELKRNSRNK